MSAHLQSSPSTVRNRIDYLDRDGIVTGYRTIVDCAKAGSLQVMIVGTADVTEREAVAASAFEIPNVIGVRELLADENTLLVEAGAELTRVAGSLTHLGVTIDEKILVGDDRFTPFTGFEPEVNGD